MGETCQAVGDLYHYFNDKSWEKHGSHIAVHAPVTGPVRLVKPNLVWRMAAQLPGIEMRGREIGYRFQTVREMVGASEKEWMGVKGIGKVLAKRIRKELGHED